ncbi:MAG: GtrA family protein [Coriobacteriales bacterium]|nr:GtrA family protein [Coriobacteriales bacterium]
MDRLIQQVLKFGVVGFLAFGVDYGVLMLLTQAFGMEPVLAAGISFIVSLVFNYLASMRFVFKHRDDMSRSREFIIFLILSAIGFGINELVIWAGTALLGRGALELTFVKVLATAIVMVWNFVSRKKWLDAGE